MERGRENRAACIMITKTDVKKDNEISAFVDYCMAVACLDTIIDEKREWPINQRYDSLVIDVAREKCRNTQNRIVKYLPHFAQGYLSNLKRKIAQAGLDISISDNLGNVGLTGVSN